MSSQPGQELSSQSGTLENAGAPSSAGPELTASGETAAAGKGSQLDSRTSDTLAFQHANPNTSTMAAAAAADAGNRSPAGGDLIDFADESSTGKAAGGGLAEPPAIKQTPAGDHAHQDAMASSVATLKPVTSPTAETSTQYLNVETKSYVDPTPPTPYTSQPPSRSTSNAAPRPRHGHSPSDVSPTRLDTSFEDRKYASESDEEQRDGSASEIQSIMEQFSEEGGGPGADEVMSPRLEITSPVFGGASQHPPRHSSLEPIAPNLAHQISELQGLRLSSGSPASSRSGEKEREKRKEKEDHGPPVPPKDDNVSPAGPNRGREDRQGSSVSIEAPMSPTMSLHRPPPPEPEPEPSLPFDFHRFLEQLRNKKADPVARYLKSFLSEFGKKQWMVHEQVKIIGDFLVFIANKMAQCEVWRDVPDAEFDNAREGMEKLVMNRLYAQTFSPAIAPPQPIPGAKSRKRAAEKPMGPGRRGQHQEDVERDEILAQKINIYGWVREDHLDIPPVNDSGRRFLKLAQQEILKIRSYRAPRDKIICVLNCCKVIFGLLRHSKSDSSADSFMPMLIYVILQANPPDLVSNVQYILRFRNQEKLGGEAGYYLSSLMGAIQFVENMDRTTLTITDEEFEQNVEAAVSAIAEKHRSESPPPAETEKASSNLQPPGESSTRPSFDTDPTSTPRRSTSSEGDSGDEKGAITGLLRSIQKPLSTIGRMLSDEPPTLGSDGRSPVHTPQPDRLAPHAANEAAGRPPSRHHLSAEEAAARQASAEVAEAQRLHRAEHANVVETLSSMFPDLDRDIISDVVYQKEGRVGLAVDACLALSA